ncbi:hypothetical protein [Roseofilum capinflatum]|uniref:Oligosaccharide repeat unit polymerase n=1 Tax=Roseofilum capinflatum BLCC-M114 TaxID=3022440 RepID=A0ABT7B891_9CYAN|nr:hypothetical protein [Roseofilum capinflatum]MDJ1175394.1 hypothetical protein [Roseofilum capinflatum BLCC-M114]
MTLIIALIVVLVIVYLSCLDWRRSVKTVLLLVVIEGALRKWVLPQASELIYFLKDIVLFGAYIQYYALSKSSNKFPIIKQPFVHIFLFLIFSWCLFHTFNPSLGSPIIGLWGLRNYFYYLPLIWMMPNLFPSEEELYNFLRSHLLLVIPVGLLGIAQFFSPASSPLNVYAPGQEASTGIATFGVSGTARITGTFSYINNYVPYLLVCFALLISLLSQKLEKKQYKILIIEMLLVVINSFMTGSRTIIFGSFLFVIGYVFIKGINQFSSILRLLKWIAPPGLIFLVIVSMIFYERINQILDRILLTNDVVLRLSLLFQEPIHNIGIKVLDGFGPGSTHQATGILRSVLRLPTGEVIPVGYESEMGRIILEIGPIGFIFWYGLRIGIMIALLVLVWKLKRPLLRDLALSAFLIHLIWLPGQLVFNNTFSLYYWFLSGFIFLLPYLERVENWRKQHYLLHQYDQFSYFSDSSYGES